MNANRILQELKERYPGKNIVQNGGINPTEIICEVDPVSRHSDYSIAIAIIDKSKPHYHSESTEIYEVINGEVSVKKNNVTYHLKKGETLVINPHEIHEAIGGETWVKVTSRPGWRLEDHHFTSSP